MQSPMPVLCLWLWLWQVQEHGGNVLAPHLALPGAKTDATSLGCECLEVGCVVV